jgi:predicted PhzF superfamily epimerase YddE/YHI9
MATPYYEFDAFTGEPCAGKPGGVCILSALLADSIIQKITAENRHSKTAFVALRADGDFDLLWFAPKVADDLWGTRDLWQNPAQRSTPASTGCDCIRHHDAAPYRN